MSHQMILMLSHLETGSVRWKYGRGSSDSLKIAEEENTMVHWKLKRLKKAKVHVLHMVQRSHFSKDIAALSSSRKVPRRSRLSKLDVFIDGSGLIRVGGRIRHSSLSDDIKHPVVLPSGHEVSSQIIQYFHQRSHHQEESLVLRSVVSVFGSCLCRILWRKWFVHVWRVLDYVANLWRRKWLIFRRKDCVPSFPFWFCCCDLFGPFWWSQVGGRLNDMGFCCLASKAVHIEVVHSLSTDSFINAFRRFVALRGSIREIRCDQGTNFVGARNELLKMGCDMVFNPPASSHRGGIWERLIGSARRIIEGILCEHGSRFDEGLMTILSEAASMINSRPLNVDNISDPQSLEPLTPNHLITMKFKVIPKSLAPIDTERSDLYVSRQWRRVQYLIGLFWSRWKKEIIQQYMSRAKWNRPRENLKVGDVVLVVGDQCHRSCWKVAGVSEEHMSRDGLVRFAKVQFADRSVLHRPVQKLIELLCDWDWFVPRRGACWMSCIE